MLMMVMMVMMVMMMMMMLMVMVMVMMMMMVMMMIAFQARAFGDQWGKLLPMQCHIIKDGREIRGKAGKTKCAGDSR